MLYIVLWENFIVFTTFSMRAQGTAIMWVNLLISVHSSFVLEVVPLPLYKCTCTHSLHDVGGCNYLTTTLSTSTLQDPDVSIVTLTYKLEDDVELYINIKF